MSKDNKDQFYTKKDVAEKYYKIFIENDVIKNYDYDHILEPSAGTGSFYTLFDKNKRLGVDIEPKCDGVIKQDFLKYVHNTDKTYIVLGNPPFGRVSSLAVKFFNKAAEFSDVIGFIVPRTFKRVSIQNKLNLNYHLVFCENLPLNPCCFEPKMTAKCCFQIWEWRDEKRKKVILKKTTDDFDFLKLGELDDKKQPTPPKTADFVIKAYGANCGEVVTDNLQLLRPKSWHWIKIKKDKNIDDIIEKISKLDFSISKDTVRQDSLGRAEFVKIYEE